jgi:long-chain acyl-CoA synthetase
MTGGQSNGLRCGEHFRARGDVLDRAARLAATMQARGVGPDSNVAVLARNGIEVVECHLAARLLDANVVPINWHGTGADTLYILGQARPLMLLGDADLLAATDTAVETLAFGDEFDRAVAASQPYAGTPQGTGSSLIFTSGTSGLPKGVKRLAASPAQAEHRRAVLRLIYDAHPENRALACGPLYHLFSLATTLSNFGAGAHVTIMERFDAEDALRIIERDCITHTSFVPTMLVRLLRLPDAVKAKYDLSSLRHITQSGAPCPIEVKRALLGWLGPIIHETYGSTETGVMTQMPGPEWLKRPGSVGKPVLTGEVRVLGPDGESLPPGEVGDIYMYMHNAPDFTYLGDPEKRAAMERGGLVTVGDMGYLDEDGYLYVCDRRSDMVLVGGANVYPAEVEAALLTHPDVMDAAVFGIPDEDMGEILIAHAAPRDGAALEEAALLAQLEGRLARTKWPRKIVIDRELPRAENGKIIKRELRQRYIRKELP